MFPSPSIDQLAPSDEMFGDGIRLAGLDLVFGEEADRLAVAVEEAHRLLEQRAHLLRRLGRHERVVDLVGQYLALPKILYLECVLAISGSVGGKSKEMPIVARRKIADRVVRHQPHQPHADRHAADLARAAVRART